MEGSDDSTEVWWPKCLRNVFPFISFIELDIALEKAWASAQLVERISVTRFGDILDFGQLFKAFGNN